MVQIFNSKKLLTHVFFVSLFLLIPMLAFVRPPGEPFMKFNRIFVQDTTANFVLLCFFYLNYYVLLPKFFYTKKYVWYVLLVIVFLSFAFTLPYITGKMFANYQPRPENFRTRPDAPPFHYTSIASFAVDEFRRHLSLFFTAIFFSFLLKARERLSELQEEKLQAELSSLKAQINPHFLFNTLNSIYSLSLKKDDRAADAVLHLSGLMRYVVSDAHVDKIPLQKELEYLDNYIELQKARLGKTVEVNYACLGIINQQQIAPLILITFIENAFRYGANPDIENCSIDISIQITSDSLELQVKNDKVNLTTKFASTGIGVENTSQRLQHIYPGKHVLTIHEDQQNYSVSLIIQLL